MPWSFIIILLQGIISLLYDTDLGHGFTLHLLSVQEFETFWSETESRVFEIASNPLHRCMSVGPFINQTIVFYSSIRYQ